MAVSFVTIQNFQVSYLDFDKALELIEYIRTLPCADYVLNDGFHRHRVVIDALQEECDFKYPQEKDEEALLNERSHRSLSH